MYSIGRNTLVGYLGGTLALNYVLGLIDPATFNQHHIRNVSAALVYPMLAVFLFAGLGYIRKTACLAISKLLSAGRKRTTAQIVPLVERLIFGLKKGRLLKVVSGAVVASLMFGLSLSVVEDIQRDAIFLVMTFQAMPLWVASFLVIRTTIKTYTAIRKHLKKHARIQLFEVQRLEYISTFIIVIIAVYCGGLAIYSAQAIVTDLALGEIVLSMVVFSLALIAALLPSRVAILKLKREKQSEITLINKHLDANINNNIKQAGKKRLVDDEERLNYVADLLLVRKSISDIPVFPISIPIFMKLFLLFVLPVLSWFGAGLISQLLQLAE